ncbi:hypothetical protein BX600DRAFT_466306 [Xylariales sp. PMI_506]|nr:hypothetical protein BX600DRAFT_466306 [Xylariales sp. PMI_506]
MKLCRGNSYRYLYNMRCSNFNKICIITSQVVSCQCGFIDLADLAFPESWQGPGTSCI